MTEKVTKSDLRPAYNNMAEAARVQALGMLAIAQSIDGLTRQIERLTDNEIKKEKK